MNYIKIGLIVLSLLIVLFSLNTVYAGSFTQCTQNSNGSVVCNSYNNDSDVNTTNFNSWPDSSNNNNTVIIQQNTRGN